MTVDDSGSETFVTGNALDFIQKVRLFLFRVFKLMKRHKFLTHPHPMTSHFCYAFIIKQTPYSTSPHFSLLLYFRPRCVLIIADYLATIDMQD